ncbi:MAG: hypothetical protein HOP33_13675 [Verrucomicrobia bacterium]|nr:hypothetical protein [Verrucomicrobiota bacterium]
MNDSSSKNSQGSTHSAAPQDMGFSPWQRLKSKNISYLTLPLLAMATVVEFVILATGWKYQQMVCLPQGMGVTFFGIGPIGATILAVELLKLPLAIWTASRTGWQKGFMLILGLPLICVLTFQLVKDMAVYEMGTAMTPANQLLEKATAEEIKIAHLQGQLTGIDGKKQERERKLAEFAAKKAKAKAELEEELKRTDAARTDAISLTDYQSKELSGVEAKQGTITRQFDIDAAQISKAIADLRASRETEVSRASKWNAEEARIENAYKTKLADYTNKKKAYEKDKADYANANVLKRQLMREPVDPGVAPDREANTILKPTLIADLDAQIKAKETELIVVNNKRRDSVAQVAEDARRVREEFDRRSSTKREESDRKREALLAAQTALNVQLAAEEKELDQSLAVAVQKVDGIRAEVDAARKKAEGLYEAREASIRTTQVHRIATTVEIVRGLLFGERPMSVTATAKQRGDILTDQISMVRIWVYPVLAFIVAFLPTLMVEIGFSTLFKPEQQRPAHRLGFFGRRLHWLYTRAGRQKILRAERMTREVSTAVAVRDQALAAANANAEKVLAEKDAELQAARETIGTVTAAHEEQLRQKEYEWVAQLGATTDSLNRAILEKDALRDLQKSEVERQIQMRQNAWSDRITQLRQELDDQRAAAEAERTTLLQEHHKKLMEVTESSKTQVIQARRQTADAELAAVETSAKMAHDLKEALYARDNAESQLQQQAEALSLKLTQAKEDADREMEKAARQEKHRLERQQLEFTNTLRQRDENFERQLNQREQELSVAFDARLAEEQTKTEQEARRREEEFARQLETRVRETDIRWKQEVQQREDAVQNRLKQREQQLQAQAEVRLNEMQTQAEQQLHRRESELERQLDAQSREAVTRLEQELQQRELSFQARLKKREQELTAKADARETELQNQWAADSRAREEEWERQAEARVRAAETRSGHEAQEKEELFQSKLRQRDQQWQVKLEATRAELQAQTKQVIRRREVEAETSLREMEAQLRKEMHQKDEAAQAKAEQREQDLVAQLTAQAEAHRLAAQAQWEKESEEKTRAAIEPFKALLARNEKERDDAKQSASRAVNQMRDLEKKLMEASSFLSGWKNGKHSVVASVERDVFEVARDGLGSSGE